METREWWGYISIDADAIPARLSNDRSLFLNRAWVKYRSQRGFWIPWEKEPSQEVVSEFEAAQVAHEIDSYRIVHPMPVE